MRSMNARVRTLATGLAVLAGFIALPASPAHASSVTVVCGGGASTQSVSVGVQDTLVFDYGSCSGITTMNSGPGTFFLNGVPTSFGVPLSGETLTFIAPDSGPASIELDSAMVYITVTSAGSEHVPGVGVPRAIDLPGNPTATSAVGQRGGVSVSWTPPSWSGEGTITRYAVFATGQTSSDALCVADAPATSCTVTTLPPGEAHTFYVKAFSPIGWGTASPPSNSAAGLPSNGAAPTALIAVNEGIFVIARIVGSPEPGSAKQFEIAQCDKPCVNPATDASSWSAGNRSPDLDGDAVFTTTSKAVLWAVRGRYVAMDGQVSDWVYGTEAVSKTVEAPVNVIAAAPRRGTGTDLMWEAGVGTGPMVTQYEIEYQTRLGKEDTSAYADWAPLGTTPGTAVPTPVKSAAVAKDVYVRVRVRAYAPVSTDLGTPVVQSSSWSTSNWVLETSVVVPAADSVRGVLATDKKTMRIMITPPALNEPGAAGINNFIVRMISARENNNTVFERSISAKQVADAGSAGFLVTFAAPIEQNADDLSLRVQSVSGTRASAWVGGPVS